MDFKAMKGGLLNQGLFILKFCSIQKGKIFYFAIVHVRKILSKSVVPDTETNNIYLIKEPSYKYGNKIFKSGQR
jgi:hypothetical protein